MNLKPDESRTRRWHDPRFNHPQDTVTAFAVPRGNCDFWIYKPYKGEYRLILETGNVQIFGFLKSRTKGYPDLVTWSHASAFDSEAQLFRFDGNQYVRSGGWEEEWEYPGDNGEMVKPDRPRITSHFSAADTIPQ